jgi:regulatory protein
LICECLCLPLCTPWLNTLINRRKRKQDEADAPLDPAKARARVFQRAAKLLAAKQRSIEELREKLSTTRGATKAMVDEAIERLREYGYLDDAKFAQSYASLRLRERPIGRRRLQRDLWLKKVDKPTVEAALDEVFESTPEGDLIDRAIAKRVRLRGKPKTREEAKKLFDHLLRQGFEFELVSEKVRALAKSEVE